MSKIQQRQDIRKFVMERKKQGAPPDAIAEEVNDKWPGWKMTARGVHRIGWSYKTAWDGDGKKAAPLKEKPTTCHYIVYNGKVALPCGASGYPYCANHRSKVAPEGGSKYPHVNKLF